MSVMASGATVCINTAGTHVYRKTPIWFQPNALSHTSPWIISMENKTGLSAKHLGERDGARTQWTDKTTL